MTSITAQEWREYLQTCDEANFLQSIEWGAANERVGHTVIRGGVIDDGVIVAGWQGIIKNAKRGRYLEVPGGPLMDWTNAALVKKCLEQLKGAGKKHRCVFIRIRPQIGEGDIAHTQLEALGLRRAPFHLHAEHTNILDLTQSEDELLAGMRRQTRYEVRAADKKGVVVSWQSSAAAVGEFFQVQADTAKRQGFIPPSREFLAAQVAAFGDNARIYRAEKDGMLLNLALVILSGNEADYFEAASTPEARQYPGAYAVQWRAIRDAKAVGKTRYNFWGVAYTDDPNHRFAGVTTFKRGFGGRDATYMPAYDIVLRPKYLMTWLIETIRKKRRKL